MKQLLFAIAMVFSVSPACSKNDKRTMNATPDTNINAPKPVSFLALGDSYTIGESVPPEANFPNQTATLLQAANYFTKPRIIARTGWTTDELESGILAANQSEPISENYDFVTLLIGVNNQYRGRTVDDYKPEFKALLEKAVKYAGNRPDHVAVISIPDWGATPFANGRDRDEIARQIDAYNNVNKDITRVTGSFYIDITPWTREALSNPALVASDGLHPSALEYKRWAEKLRDIILLKMR